MTLRTYISSDDSVLLRSALRNHSGESCLEIGAGNGGGLIELSKGFGRVVGTDLHRPSDDSWKAPSVDYVLADAACCFREGSFDLIAFNPPYVPTQDLMDDTVDGGPEGIRVALRFLGEAIRVMKGSGKIVMLLSSDNPLARVKTWCDGVGLSLKAVAAKHIFFETLTVYELSR